MTSSKPMHSNYKTTVVDFDEVMADNRCEQEVIDETLADGTENSETYLNNTIQVKEESTFDLGSQKPIAHKQIKKVLFVKEHETKYESARFSSSIPETSHCAKLESSDKNSDQCVKSSTQKLDLDIYSKKKPYKCLDCHKSFIRIKNYIRHRRLHTGDILCCLECGKGFCDRRSVALHRYRHLEEKPHECENCPKRFAGKEQLTSHQRLHTGKKTHKCGECDKSFLKNSQLLIHKRTHTGETPFHCNHCGKKFARKSCLTSHERVHTREKLFHCEYCKITHKVTHTQENPYKCKECGKNMVNKVNLIERPYECNECKKKFVRKNQLTWHKRLHTMDKSFKCDCGKAFRSNPKLVRHKRTHTGEKPFKCGDCGKSYADNWYFSKHKRKCVHTGENQVSSL